ncbi:MAG: class I mannose-6-phosphate isomerase [Niabella sp.]
MKQTRITTEALLPIEKSGEIKEHYDIYPTIKLAKGLISTNLALLAKTIASNDRIIIDGYTGVFFEAFRLLLDKELVVLGKRTNWINVEMAMKPEKEIETLIMPFMGEADSIFGTKATIELQDFFNSHELQNLAPIADVDINIIYGCGAGLSNWEGAFLYIDIPKNELQFRARAKSVRNMGASQCFDMRTMYKRYFFVDWIVLNKHKKTNIENIDIIIDGQRNDLYPWMTGGTLRSGLKLIGENFFRARPWFEPGVWGGSWIKDHIEGVNLQATNYAWSFELITPENGLVFESSYKLLEVSFDFLMYACGDLILGKDREKYQDEFPLRFDFLDTFDGGNLSIQCHPRPAYCKEHFGENITQEETYYILDRKNDAAVYLGFQDNINAQQFEADLWQSFNSNTPLNIENYVQVFPANKHDLFLIPPGTIHGSGIDNLVLEISTTPYIFTFKMYDWVRPDLDGNPRPLNIDHGMKNLYFDRKGDMVEKELISSPRLLLETEAYKLFELPTHEKHSYKVNRYHINTDVKIETNGKFHVLSLVDGTAIEVESENGKKETFCFAETFVVSAAAKSYTIHNCSQSEVMVIVAYVK